MNDALRHWLLALVAAAVVFWLGVASGSIILAMVCGSIAGGIVNIPLAHYVLVPLLERVFPI